MKEPSVSIAVPASIVADVPSLQLKTYKIGQIARASAIYCVDQILVYVDRIYSEQKSDSQLICEILRYMETPQYLRKRLFPLSPTLRFAGMLPPLNTPHHPTENRLVSLKNGEYREGVVIKNHGGESLVDVGVERPLRTNVRIPTGERRTFRITRKDKEVLLEPTDASSIPEYWGYRTVELGEPLGVFMSRKTFDLYVLTSRLGSQIVASFKNLEEGIRRSRKILIAFGSPREGLREILAREGLNEKVADLNLNTIPGQGTLSVRTEEAVQGTLAIINVLIRKLAQDS
ncbi:MAG: RNA methyltransferase [Promethearchaeati archaeon SRVP18_Atabeyarchaeia-1]